MITKNGMIFPIRLKLGGEGGIFQAERIACSETQTRLHRFLGSPMWNSMVAVMSTWGRGTESDRRNWAWWLESLDLDHEGPVTYSEVDGNRVGGGNTVKFF